MTLEEEQKLKKLVVELLDTYCPSQFIHPMGQGCQPAFIEGLYWHTIWIVDSNAVNFLERRELKGADIEEVVLKTYRAFKTSSCWLEASLCSGEKILMKPGYGNGAAEKFLVECELLGIAGGEEEGKEEGKEEGND